MHKLTHTHRMNVRFIIENALDFAPVIFLIHFPCNVIVSNEYVCQFNRKKAVKHISNLAHQVKRS